MTTARILHTVMYSHQSINYTDAYFTLQNQIAPSSIPPCILMSNIKKWPSLLVPKITLPVKITIVVLSIVKMPPNYCFDALCMG